MRPGVKKLLRFIEQPEIAYYLQLACDSFYNEFAAAHDLKDFEEIEEALGEAVNQIGPCCLEFFLSNEYVKDGQRWNVIDAFLKSRGGLLEIKDKQYLRSLRQSHMSLYEILDIDPDRSLVLRDLIEPHETIRVFEKTGTRSLFQWDIIGARLCKEGNRLILGGGILPMDRQAVPDLVDTIHTLTEMFDEMDFPENGLYAPEDIAHLKRAMWAKEIATAYMEDVFTRLNRKLVVKNRDGHDIDFHSVIFNLQADWLEIAALLNGVPDYHLDEDSSDRKFWNWVELARDRARIHTLQDEDPLIEMRIFETTLDGGDLDEPVPVLGNIELLKGALIATANSRERAEILQGRLEALLGQRIGTATLVKDELSGSDGGEREPDGEDFVISPEEEADIFHALLAKHYKEWLDNPLPQLDGRSPRQLSAEAEERARLIDLLKDAENSVRRVERQSGITQPLDLGWMWAELGLDRTAA